MLVLAHKTAVERLWKEREITVENICALHALATHDHGLVEVADSDHFLPEHQRGKPGESEEVNLGASTYFPPFRPGEGFAANVALLSGGLLPFSFADVDKVDYIRGMAAFYELQSMLVIERTFIEGYVRSVIRGSEVPLRMRGQGFDVEAVARALVDFVQTGRKPADARAAMFCSRT